MARSLRAESWQTEIQRLLNCGARRAALRPYCYILTPENTDREFAPLEAISDNYEKLVLSTDTLLRVNRGGIRQKNIIDFLLEH